MGFYFLGDKLAVGGFSSVYLAHNVSFLFFLNCFRTTVKSLYSKRSILKT
jgi:hypothetical protein